MKVVSKDHFRWILADGKYWKLGGMKKENTLPLVDLTMISRDVQNLVYFKIPLQINSTYSQLTTSFRVTCSNSIMKLLIRCTVNTISLHQ